MTKRIMKGVQDIRTLSGRVDEGTIPYKAYMKLSILEMEKFRRGKEKQSALERVRKIDQRFQDIEVARQEIMRALGAKGINSRAVSVTPEGAGPEAAPRTTTGPFKIRY
ncbi:MAG: hypothetical protein NTZ24_15465 [Deltaproteobacteria bacterium]|nr:hypothetical protein [Deltaproteobacteria bacterium]